MSWCDLIYPWLVHSALISLMVLIVGSGAALLCRQPTRRARIIELTLAGCLVAPWLGMIPGYPKLAVGRWSAAVLPPHESTPAPSAQRPIEQIASRINRQSAEPQTPQPTVDKLGHENEPSALPVQRTAPRSSVQSATTPGTAFNLSSWIVAIYAVGVGIGVGWWMVGIVALGRIVWTAQPAPPQCRELLGQIAGPAGQRVRLIASPRVNQPLASAWGRPVIVLPENLCGDGQTLRWCLAHEWTHVERHDFRVWLMAGLVRVLFFYHPLVWWMRRQLRLCQDYVADSRAARHAPQPEDYAEFLTVRAAAGSLHPAIVALGMGFHKSELYRRVVMLVENQPIESRTPRLWSASASLVALLLIGALAALLSVPKAAAEGDLDKSGKPNNAKREVVVALEPEPFTAKLPSGITVELIGVCENPSKDKPWWRPDGSPLTERPYDTVGVDMPCTKDQVAREFAVRLQNLPAEPADTLWQFPAADGWGRGNPKRRGTGAVTETDVQAGIATLPRTRQTTVVGFGVAARPWRTVAERQKGEGAHLLMLNKSESLGSVVFSPVAEEDKSAFVTVSYMFRGGDTRERVRVVAVGNDGREHYADRPSDVFVENLHQITAKFPNFSLKEIDCFRLQTRPYQWVEFHNVSLYPGHKTQVTAAVAPPERQAASTQSTSSQGAVPPIENEAAAKIEKALRSPTQIEFADTPLQDVVDYLKDYHKIEIQLDKKALSDVGVATDKPITANFKGITLRSALRLLLKQHDLTYLIQDEVLLITSTEQAENNLETVIYPVGDLVLPPNPTEATEPDFDSLIDLIKVTVKPTSWDETGGVGSIMPFENNLSIAVSQTEEVHPRIVELLEKLRTVSREQGSAGWPAFKPRPSAPKPKSKPKANSDEEKSPRSRHTEKPND